jgi:putative ABC transport system substrate-binding protein
MWGAVAQAQQPEKIRRIGFLAVNSPSTDRHLNDTFKQSLRELGWIEGRNITIEYRSAEGKTDRLPALAAELVGSKVDVIVSPGGAGCPGGQEGYRYDPHCLHLEWRSSGHRSRRQPRSARW